MSRRIATPVLVFLVWTIEGLLWTAQMHVSGKLAGKQWSLSGVALVQMGTALAWALATLLLLRLARRYPLAKGTWVKSLAVHLGTSLVVSFAIDVLFVWLQELAGRPDIGTSPLLTRAFQMFVGWVDFNLLIYWVILVGTHALGYYRSLQQRDLKEALLETQLTKARLDALEMQLHPHFLFNALNTVSALVRSSQNAQAVKVVASLGDLLRRTLDRRGGVEIPLREELEFVHRYLEIEQIRFGDRLEVAVEAGASTLEARVPTLILQPLVENAIRHGVAPRAARGRVGVRAWREGERLRLEVTDDGVGLPPAFDLGRHAGVGLGNTRERLERLHPGRHLLRVAARPGGGTTVQVSLPYRPEAAERSA